jgi:signal peptidase I
MKRTAGYALVVLVGLLVWPLALMNVMFPLGSPLLVALSAGAGTGVIRPYTIASSAMEPTLHCAEPAPGCEADRRDQIMVRTWGSYGRGDIIVFRAPPEAELKCAAGGKFVKRIIGLPGELVAIRLRQGAAYVYIDGKRLEEPYIEGDRRDIGPEGTFRAPQDHYFVMGDNRSQSCDSRVWGAVPEDSIIGKVFMTYPEDSIIGKVFMTYWPPLRIFR